MLAGNVAWKTVKSPVLYLGAGDTAYAVIGEDYYMHVTEVQIIGWAYFKAPLGESLCFKCSIGDVWPIGSPINVLADNIYHTEHEAKCGLQRNLKRVIKRLKREHKNLLAEADTVTARIEELEQKLKETK